MNVCEGIKETEFFTWRDRTRVILRLHYIESHKLATGLFCLPLPCLLLGNFPVIIIVSVKSKMELSGSNMRR